MTYTVHQSIVDAEFLAFLAMACEYSIDETSNPKEYTTGLNFKVRFEGQTVGAFSCDVEKYGTHNVLYVLAAGASAGNNVIPKIVSFCLDAARMIGADFIACDSKRKGMARVLKSLGFQVRGTYHFKAV